MYMKAGDNEMKDIIDFVNYEKINGRQCEIEAIRECTACKARGGCMTDLVCHTAPLENAISILKCGSLLSAVNARKLPDTVLQKEDHKVIPFGIKMVL